MTLLTKMLLAAALTCQMTVASAATDSTATRTTATTTTTSAPETIVPVPRPEAKNNKFEKRHREILKRVKQGSSELVFIGDSITDQWHKVPAIWEEAFGKWKPINMGVGGDRTQNVLWRLENGELESISPKVAVLMIGTNNTHSNSPEDIVLGIRRIIETIHQKSPQTKVLLLAIFPREPRERNGKPYTMPVEKVRAINRLLPALADGKQVRYLDIGSKFLKDGAVPKEIMPDGLHLSEQGYRIWADAITPTLNEMLAE